MVFTETRRLIVALTGSGCTARVIGIKLGMTPQRVHQHWRTIAYWYARRGGFTPVVSGFRIFLERHALDILAIERMDLDRIRALYPQPASQNEKLQAQEVAYAARINGELGPRSCELCNASAERAMIAHHTDYSKPLAVHFLCPSCHATVHYYHRAEVLLKKGA